MIDSNPALTVALALAAGMLAQILARHILMPGIVVLLFVGVLLGPDVAGVVRPGPLGEALPMLVGFAIAVILFEGGMSLDLRRLRQEAVAIRRLVTIGAFITGAGGTLAAHYLMGWDWRFATLFGTLVIVTGPTVITPLVRRLRLKEPTSTILQAEGVLIDPIGALIAVVALEVLYADNPSVTGGLSTTVIVLGTGAAVGLIGGLLITLLLKHHRLVPEGMENILVLALVVAVFQIAELAHVDSGLTAVVAAGMVVGNSPMRARKELVEFKEQLTVLLIGLLFVLLAADVRLEAVYALGWPAVLTVAALMLIVRPLQVFLCTIGSNLKWQERLFIALLAPRGIVAAAVASLFAQQLAERGVEDADALRALVFLVIAATVTIHGLSGPWIAKALHVRRPSGQGYVMLGANAIARALGGVLREDGHEVMLIDNNMERVVAAEAADFRVLYGQGLQGSVLAEADVDSRIGCIGITANEEVNILFVQKVREESRVPSLYVALRRERDGVPAENVHELGASVLFGRSRRLNRWSDRLEKGAASVEYWTRELPQPPDPTDDDPVMRSDVLLIIAVRRRGRMQPFDDDTTLGAKEEIALAVADDRRDEADALLREAGWTLRAPESTAAAIA